MNPYEILLADDHPLFREGIKRIIEGEPALKIVGQAGDGLELLQLLRKLSPQLVILDISMPNLGGLEAIGEIRRLYPRLKVLILTMHKSRGHLHRAISMRVEGFLCKEDAHADLILAINTIRKDGTYISPLLRERIVELFSQQFGGNVEVRSENLSNREIQVLKLLAEGKSSKEIAALLFIGIRTVHSHRRNINIKLNARKHSELVRYAIQQGYISVNS